MRLAYGEGVRCWALAILVLAACGKEHTDIPLGPAAVDAAIRPDGDPCGIRPDLPLCSTSCGNNQIESCYYIHTHFTFCEYRTRTEQCDSEQAPTCAELGLYGDQKPCTSSCDVDRPKCEPCSPSNVACAAVGGSFRVAAVAASGVRVGMIEPDVNAGVGPQIWAVNHLTKVGDVPDFPRPRSRAIVGVANGWLIAGTAPNALYTFDGLSTSELGPARQIDTDEPALAYGPGQRAIVAWSEGSAGSYATYFELVDEIGQLVVAKTQLFAGDSSRPGVDTDGTSFFVGSRGSLARISSTGTTAITTGFPTSPMITEWARVTWHGTTGWYLTMSQTGYVAQRFDASGSPIGSVIDIGMAADVLADGNDLLVLRSVGGKLLLGRIDPNGVELASLEVGGAMDPARIVRAAGTLYVVWSWFWKLRIAQVAI